MTWEPGSKPRVQTMTVLTMIKEPAPRLFLVSRDPMVERSFARRLRAAGIEIAQGYPAEDYRAAPPTESGQKRSKDMIVLGPGDLRLLRARLGPAVESKAILVCAPVANVASVLNVLGRFGRPRQGDGIVVLEDYEAPLDAVVALAASGYLAIPRGVVAGLVERAAFQRLGATLGVDDIRLLSLLAKGLANRQIADELGWEQSQVKSRLRVLMRRLNLKNRTAMAVAAIRLGISADR